MLKRILAILISVSLMLSFAGRAQATTYDDLVDLVDDTVQSMYNDANSAPQQSQAMFFGIMYMLNIIEDEIDTDGSRTDAVDELVDAVVDSIDKVSGADQVSALCLYGSVMILGAIAYEKDSYGLYSSYIKDVMDDLTDVQTSGASQEMANASYRMADMLSIIAFEEGVDSDIISKINDIRSSNDSKATSVLQQTVNGLYRSAELIAFISAKTHSNYLSNRVSKLLDSMYEDDDSCESAAQQIVNGSVTVYCMLRDIARGLA